MINKYMDVPKLNSIQKLIEKLKMELIYIQQYENAGLIRTVERDILERIKRSENK